MRRRRRGGHGRVVILGAALGLTAGLLWGPGIPGLHAGAAPAAALGNYDPASFGWRPGADLVPFRYRGLDCGRVARLAEPLFAAAFDRLVPHMPGGRLHSCDCYAYRNIRGGDSLSFHAYGLACDVDSDRNPYRLRGWAPHTLPDNTGALVRPYGMEWGGDWTAPIDYMHIELHLSRRAAARRLQQKGST